METEFVDFNASKSSNNKNTEQIKLNIKIPDVTITRLKTSDSNSENGLKKILNTNKLGSSLLSLKPFSQTIHSQVSYFKVFRKIKKIFKSCIVFYLRYLILNFSFSKGQLSDRR